MKIVADVESFVSAIQFVSKSFDTKNEKAFIALVIDDGQGYLSHDSISSFMKSPISLQSVTFAKGEEEEELRLALNGAFLQKLGSVLSGAKGEMVLSKDLTKNNSPLRVVAPTGRFTIPIFDSKIPDLKKVDSLGFIDDYRYFDTLARLSKICDTKHETGVALLSTITVTFDSTEKTVSLMATDRYAMGEVVLDFTPEDEEAWLEDNPKIFIPSEFTTLIPPSKDGGVVNLVREPVSKKYGYAFDDGRVALFALKDIANALEYGKQKEEVLNSIEKTFLAPLVPFKKALNNVAALSWEEQEIFVNISASGNVAITDLHQENIVAVPTEDFKVKDGVESENIRIAFVREVILEALAPVTSESLMMGVKNAKAPVTFRNVNEENEPTDDTYILAIPVA